MLSLDKDYRAEQEHSRSLQAELQASKSGSKLAQSVSTTPDEAEKDAQCLRLYEDLTDICVVSVKVEQGGKGGKEVVFNCIHTVGGRSECRQRRSHTISINSIIFSFTCPTLL